MSKTTIRPLAWLTGMIFAPHGLALMGNLAGAHQMMFLVWLVPAAGLYYINARAAHQVASAPQTSNLDDGTPVLTTLLLASRALTTLALSSVLLVTAGFVFNETIARWFPNFAFAFMLLGLLLAVHLWGGNAPSNLQIVATGVVLAGLAALIIMGLLGSPPTENVEDGNAVGFSLHGMTSVLLLLVGFDLAFSPKGTRQELSFRTAQWGITAVVVLIGLWAWVGMRYVPAERLSDSYIPHLLTARAVQGEVGRIIMAIVVIAGSVAAVNALFHSLAALLSGFRAWQCPGGGLKWLDALTRPAIWHVMITVAVGLMMAGGMAGTDAIDLYVRAGLILWVLYYAGLNMTALKMRRRDSRWLGWEDGMLPTVGAVAMCFSAGALLLTDPESVLLLKPLIIIGILVSMVVFAGYLLKRALRYEMNCSYHRQR